MDIERRWELVSLGGSDGVVDIIRGVTYDKKEVSLNTTQNVILTADNITLKGEFELNKQIFLNDNIVLQNEKRLLKDDIFICLSSGSKKHVGKIAYLEDDTDYYAVWLYGSFKKKGR